MFCQNCGNQIADGTGFCPYCGTQQTEATASVQAPQYAQPQYTQPQAQAPQYTTPYQDPYAGQQYGAPAYDPNNPYGQGYGAQQGVNDSDVTSTKTLGIVALVVGLFVPLVGYICGGIGLSKVRKLSMFANPMQKEQLDKNKVLCILGIVIPAVINLIYVIVSIANS